MKLGLGEADEFEDALLMNGLAGLDCVELGLDFSELTQEEFEHLPFDSKTVFSEETKAKFHPEKILEKKKVERARAERMSEDKPKEERPQEEKSPVQPSDDSGEIDF